MLVHFPPSPKTHRPCIISLNFLSFPPVSLTSQARTLPQWKKKYRNMIDTFFPLNPNPHESWIFSSQFTLTFTLHSRPFPTPTRAGHGTDTSPMLFHVRDLICRYFFTSFPALSLIPHASPTTGNEKLFIDKTWFEKGVEVAVTIVSAVVVVVVAGFPLSKPPHFPSLIPSLPLSSSPHVQFPGVPTFPSLTRPANFVDFLTK